MFPEVSLGCEEVGQGVEVELGYVELAVVADAGVFGVFAEEVDDAAGAAQRGDVDLDVGAVVVAGGVGDEAFPEVGFGEGSGELVCSVTLGVK